MNFKYFIKYEIRIVNLFLHFKVKCVFNFFAFAIRIIHKCKIPSGKYISFKPKIITIYLLLNICFKEKLLG